MYLLHHQHDAVEVFLDFDRTLTNGFAAGADLPLARRVRGGAPTVAALRRAHDAGVRATVLTARPPRPGTVAQLFASLRGPQREVGAVLLAPGDRPGDAETVPDAATVGGHGLALAADARLYAAGCQKPAALAHALMARHAPDGETPVVVYFVDDQSTNAHDVGTRLAGTLAEARRRDLTARVAVRCVWWDTLGEDMGLSPSMEPVLHGAERGYEDHVVAQLLAFGVSSAEALRRRARYAALAAAAGRPEAEERVARVGRLQRASAEQEKIGGCPRISIYVVCLHQDNKL